MYNESQDEDGRRILIDRLWQRGLSKDKAKVNILTKDISPSTELRRRYHQNPEQ